MAFRENRPTLICDPRNLWYNLSTLNWMLCVSSAAKPSYGLAAFYFRRAAGQS